MPLGRMPLGRMDTWSKGPLGRNTHFWTYIFRFGDTLSKIIITKLGLQNLKLILIKDKIINKIYLSCPLIIMDTLIKDKLS